MPRKTAYFPFMTASEVYALILAAGRGNRFGGDKLLVTLQGKPLLRHALDWVAEARATGRLGGAVAVVPTGNAARERLLIQSDVEPVVNTTPELGVGESLRLGIGALADRHAGARAALVLLGDQPFLRLEVLDRLLESWRGGHGPVVRPRYAGAPAIPGHPVLLDRSIWERAGELRGDSGFAPLLQGSPGLVTTVDVSGINPDIDTRAQLAAFESPVQ